VTAAIFIGAAVLALIVRMQFRSRDQKRRDEFRRSAQKRARARRNQYFLL